MKLIGKLSVIFYLTVSLPAAEQIIDHQVGYSVQLPGDWVHEVADATHHQFFDTSGTYQSIIAIVRYDFTSAVSYSTAIEWTRANFIAYQITIESDPLSALSFYDTVTARQNDTLWAADAYSYYFDPDTALGDWAEYIRFTGVEKRGYEIYAIGPAADLDSNIATYASIIQSITILDSATDISVRRKLSPVRFCPQTGAGMDRVNILGRSVGSRDNNAASQLFIIPHYKQLRLR